MNKTKSIRNLTKIIALRSRCRIKVGAVIYDKKNRIISWGWNSSGKDGKGWHAERHAIYRANPKRLKGAFMSIRAFSRNPNNELCSKPCPDCEAAIKRREISHITYHP